MGAQLAQRGVAPATAVPPRLAHMSQVAPCEHSPGTDLAGHVPPAWPCGAGMVRPNCHRPVVAVSHARVRCRDARLPAGLGVQGARKTPPPRRAHHLRVPLERSPRAAAPQRSCRRSPSASSSRSAPTNRTSERALSRRYSFSRCIGGVRTDAVAPGKASGPPPAGGHRG